jgi:hypothetical protein
VYRQSFYGELPIVTNLYHGVEGGERSKMKGRSWVHPLRLIFTGGTPFSLRIEGKTKYYFLVFSTEKRANFDYNKVFGHGEFNDDIYN